MKDWELHREWDKDWELGELNRTFAEYCRLENRLAALELKPASEEQQLRLAAGKLRLQKLYEKLDKLTSF